MRSELCQPRGAPLFLVKSSFFYVFLLAEWGHLTGQDIASLLRKMLMSKLKYTLDRAAIDPMPHKNVSIFVQIYTWNLDPFTAEKAYSKLANQLYTIKVVSEYWREHSALIYFTNFPFPLPCLIEVRTHTPDDSVWQQDRTLYTFIHNNFRVAIQRTCNLTDTSYWLSRVSAQYSINVFFTLRDFKMEEISIQSLH